MPVDYGSITEEHLAVRTAAGLFDVSHMGRSRSLVRKLWNWFKKSQATTLRGSKTARPNIPP